MFVYRRLSLASFNISNRIYSLKEVKLKSIVDKLYIKCTTLRSLEGCPDHITLISCNFNKLTNFKGCSKNLIEIYCHSNNLLSFEGLPDTVQHINCDSNKISSLIGCPSSVIELSCNSNLLTNLKGCPPNLKYLSVSNNTFLTDISDLPPTVETIGLDYSDNITILPKKINTTLEILFPTLHIKELIHKSNRFDILEEDLIHMKICMKSDADDYFNSI